MFNIEGLKVFKEGDEWIVTDDIREFKINSETLEPSEDWFCSYEVIKRILSVIEADNKLTNE